MPVQTVHTTVSAKKRKKRGMEGYISYLCVYLLLMIDDAAAGGGLSPSQKTHGRVKLQQCSSFDSSPTRG